MVLSLPMTCRWRRHACCMPRADARRCARPCRLRCARCSAAEAVRLAASLARLGDFNLDAQWSQGRALAGRPGRDAAQDAAGRGRRSAAGGGPSGQQLVRARHSRRSCRDAPPQIALEIQELYAPLANRLGIWSLKWELEDLAFRELHPEDYQRIAAALNEKRRDRERYIEDVVAALDRGAGSAPASRPRWSAGPSTSTASTGRCSASSLAFEQVFDVRAVRIIVDYGGRLLCGARRGARPVALPAQRVRRLHRHAEGQQLPLDPHRGEPARTVGPLEVQIRTREMQDQAELGVAAHWRYKEGGGDRRYDEKIQQVRELLQGEPAQRRRAGAAVGGPVRRSRLCDDTQGRSGRPAHAAARRWISPSMCTATWASAAGARR